jgi:hypothetical protein
MRRTFWLATGAALGVGGTLWAEQRVRRSVQQAADRLAPQQLAAGARTTVRQASERLRLAIEAAREERARREDELWGDLHAEGLAPRPEGAVEVGRRPGASGASRPWSPALSGPSRPALRRGGGRTRR